MRIVIENADTNDFDELAKLARQGKINTFYMTDENERPKGEWVRQDDKWVQCSNCKDGLAGISIYGFKYCPFCGAEMAGIENEK